MSKLQRLGTYLLRPVGNRWSILFGLASIAAGNAHHLFYPNSPAEASWSIGGGVFAFCFIGMLMQRIYVLESENEPMLTLTFEPRNEFMRLAHTKYSIETPALFVLVPPVVTSKRPLRRCVGRLVDICVLKGDEWKRLAHGTSTKLRWQDQRSGPFEPITLLPVGSSRQFLDVFR